MRIVRTLLCDQCDFQWSNLCDSDDPCPDCPVCEAVSKRIPGPFAIATSKSKAIDVAQSVVEDEWGMTDVKTDIRDGETAAKAPAPMQTAEREDMIRAMIEASAAPAPVSVSGQSLQPQIDKFWQHSPSTQAGPVPGGGLDGYATGAAQARDMGADPIGLVHEAGKKGVLGRNGMALKVLSKPESNDQSLLAS